jgi:hypothetical protein
VSFAKLVCQTVGGQFFLFCQNYMDAKLVCQTVGVALSKVGLRGSHGCRPTTTGTHPTIYVMLNRVINRVLNKNIRWTCRGGTTHVYMSCGTSLNVAEFSVWRCRLKSHVPLSPNISNQIICIYVLSKFTHIATSLLECH